MKKNTHPNYTTINVRCSCGETFNTRSTLKRDLSLDVCDKCHPFFTGKQRDAISGGRVDQFKKRFGLFGSKSQ